MVPQDFKDIKERTDTEMDNISISKAIIYKSCGGLSLLVQPTIDCVPILNLWFFQEYSNIIWLKRKIFLYRVETLQFVNFYVDPSAHSSCFHTFNLITNFKNTELQIDLNIIQSMAKNCQIKKKLTIRNNWSSLLQIHFQ